MITSRPVIFISAVSRELRSTRDLVAKTLIALGYEPKWQDIAPTETGDLRAVLRKWVDESHAVLQIVGHRYGHGPREPDETFGPVSYTQYEALYAKAKGRKVWYILLDEHHPTDCPDDEPEDLKKLQADYRIQVKAHHGLYHNSYSLDKTEIIVLRLRDDLAILREEFMESQKRQDEALGKIQGQNEDVLQAVEDLRKMLASTIKGGSKEELNQDYESALRHISGKRGISLSFFREWLDDNATRKLEDPLVLPKDKVIALREAGRFIEARDFAISSALRLEKERQETLAEETGLWIQAAESEITLGNYAAALSHAEKADSLTDMEKDFPLWCAARHTLGKTLYYSHEFGKCAGLFRDLVACRIAKDGEDHPGTLQSWNVLCAVLETTHQTIEAEQQTRIVLRHRERVLGPEHPDTLSTRHNLSHFLDKYGRYVESEAENRAILGIRERVLGPDHIDSLASRSNLAIALSSQGKYAEAGDEFRTVKSITERLMGPRHPATCVSLYNLASFLSRHGGKDEALSLAETALEGFLHTWPDGNINTLAAKDLIYRLREGKR